MIDSYKLETDETVEQEGITKPTKYDQTFPSIYQHYNTHIHSVHRNIILVVEYYLSMEKDPSLSLKINYGAPLPIYFIHPRILLFGKWSTFLFVFVSFPTSTFL